MKLKAVLFDLDDTLYDHQYCARNALEALRGRYACFQPLTLDELERQHAALLEVYHVRVLSGELTLDQARLGRFTELLTRYGGSDAPEELTRFYRGQYLAGERLVAGVVPLLERLRADGLKIGLVTNNTVAEQMGKLGRLDLERHFDALAISEGAGFSKPDPRIFAHALEALSVTAEEAVMVGDSWSADIVGARAAGVRAIWLNRYGRPSPDASMATVITAFEPLEDVLKALG